MSYCRWSSDDFQCDIYCYAHCDGGYRIHVATNRPVFKEPLPPMDECADTQAVVERHVQVMKLMENIEREKIGLPHDGETYHVATAKECADKLEALRSDGYNVPQYAIDDLREEALARDLAEG